MITKHRNPYESFLVSNRCTRWPEQSYSVPAPLGQPCAICGEGDVLVLAGGWE